MLVEQKKPRPNKAPMMLALLALAFGVAGVGYHFATKPRTLPPGQAQFPGQTTTDAERISEEERFWELLYKQKPRYQQVERTCFVENTKFKVTTGDAKQDNAFGGVLTDLMKVALDPPEKRPGRPSILVQNYDQLLSTCPTCGATYFDIDFMNINGGRPAGAAEKLRSDWNLRELCPRLDAVDKQKWTYDQQAFARYNSHLSIGYGRNYYITGAAWYALAAARFRQYIDAGAYANPQEASLVAMTLGELYRLLGRPEDAKTYFDKALTIGGLDTDAKDILTKLEALVDNGDYTLQLAPLAKMKRPPLGWYAEQILPNVNAELDYQRKTWGKLNDPDVIEQMICDTIDQVPLPPLEP
jgi:tetratricopeptide (TPR) repeat protein